MQLHLSCHLLFCKGVDYMLKSVKFYTKVGTKNLIFYIAFLFIILLGIRTINVLESSVFQYTKYFYFGYIFFNFFLILTSASMIHNKSNILTFLEKNKEKKIITVSIANLIITLFASIPIIIMILIFKNPIFDFNTVLLGVFHFFIVWITCNLFSISLGLTAATIVKNNFSIILALIIYCLFIYISYSLLPNSILIRYLTIFDDYTYIASNDLAGIIFNAEYFKDKVFVILLSFIIIFIGLINVSSAKKLLYLILSLVPAAIFILLLLDGMHEQQDGYAPISLESSERSYTIENYTMDIDIKNNLLNHTEINLIPTKNSKNISFLLDNHFNINQILIDGKQIKYSFNNNSLDIYYKFMKDKKVTIQVETESNFFSIKNNLGYDLFYVNKKAINFSGDEFHWYPTNLDTEPINFNVKINSPYTIYSNLPKPTNDTGVIFKGSAKNVSLFAGYYQNYSDNSTEYIYPLTYKVEGLRMEIDRLIKDSITKQSENFSEEELNVLKNNSYTKVVIGNWEGNSLKIDNRTLLIKYITINRGH